ncbi:MAG: outer membrane lipoprotein-sorting protein [Magnetococcales bacterium]|nr:outer membrane lipoprotein-sorting protein [Magnetococcales bacterium]
MNRVFVICVVLFALMGATFSIEAQERVLKPDDVLARVEKTLFPDQCRIYFNVVNKRPNRPEQSATLFAVRMGGDRMAALILKPTDRIGQAVLRHGNEIWSRNPGDLRPVHTRLTQGFVGGVVNTMDILPLDLSLSYRTQWNIDEGTDEQSHILDLTPLEPGSVPYGLIRMWVDKKLFAPNKVELYSMPGRLMKTMVYHEVAVMAPGLVRPRRIEVTDARNKGYVSVIHYGRIHPAVLNASVFEPKALGQLGRLMR